MKILVLPGAMSNVFTGLTHYFKITIDENDLVTINVEDTQVWSGTIEGAYKDRKIDITETVADYDVDDCGIAEFMETNFKVKHQ